MAYEPRPIDTTYIELTPEVVQLTERLAENAHDVWAAKLTCSPFFVPKSIRVF